MTASRSRARKPSPGMGSCACGRVGDSYALVLCQEHAPIPYEVTERGRREAGLMKQWDAIHPSLVESLKAREALNKAARADGRRIEARVNRESSKRQHVYIEIEP